jgi:hypothetical protein
MPRITRKARTLRKISTYINAVEKVEAIVGSIESEEDEDSMMLDRIGGGDEGETTCQRPFLMRHYLVSNLTELQNFWQMRNPR